MTTTRQKQRLLIVFAPGPKDPDYAAFARELKERSLDVAAHDILVMEALESGPSRVGDTPIEGAAVTSVRTRFSAKDGQFGVVLADKVGNVIFRADHAARLDDVLAAAEKPAGEEMTGFTG